jgi:hypothetical protein
MDIEEDEEDNCYTNSILSGEYKVNRDVASVSALQGHEAKSGPLEHTDPCTEDKGAATLPPPRSGDG